jgi:hypothetical protein
MGRTSEFLENFDGSPCDIHWTDDHEDNKGHEKLYRILNHADLNSYIMTCSILKRMKKETKDASFSILKDIGLKNQHSYTILEVKELILDDNKVEYLVFLRNPTGNIYCKDDEVWKGDWSPLSTKWTPKTRKQCNYWVTEEEI